MKGLCHKNSVRTHKNMVQEGRAYTEKNLVSSSPIRNEQVKREALNLIMKTASPGSHPIIQKNLPRQETCLFLFVISVLKLI